MTCASIGGVPSRRLIVLGRRLGTTRWYTQATVVTGADGRYSVRVPFRYSAQYRVKWSVVRTSIVRKVRARRHEWAPSTLTCLRCAQVVP